MNICKDPIKARENDFFISDSIWFNDQTTRYSKCFTTGNKKECITWEIFVVRTIHEKPAIYLSFIAYNKCRIEQIKARCDFYVSFTLSSKNTLQNSSTPSSPDVQETVTNIYPRNKEVLLYISSSIVKSFDRFMINFKIRGTLNIVDDNFPIKIETIPLNVLKNLESFLMDQKFCDVTFQTSDTFLSAHKNILAAQSPVFKRMFSTDMKEVKHGVIINMKNVEGAVLKEMFRFMYGGRVENIEKMADKLLILANKYEIEPLMTLCEKVLFDKLTISNAISTIKLADIHNAKNLRHLTEEFIIKNKNALLDTAEFKSLTSTNPQIVIDILKANLQ